ncbi:MAG: DUF6166 domain-containing protein [Nocardioides sp.]
MESSNERVSTSPLDDCGEVYYGVREEAKDGTTSRPIVVQAAASGPSERERGVETLRELEPDYGTFNWGYSGTGPAMAARAILTDAQDGVAPTPEMVGAFIQDVTSQLTDEWRLGRPAVQTWITGWQQEFRSSQ